MALWLIQRSGIDKGAGGTLSFSTTAHSRGAVQSGGSPDMQLAASQVNSHDMLGTAAIGAVPQKKTKTNSKQARHDNSAASHGGKSAKGNPLTGGAPGQGFSIQNQMSKGSGLSDAYSWRRYVPDRRRHRVLPKLQSKFWSCLPAMFPKV